MKRYNIGIVGVTGFTGHELVKILYRHPSVNLVYGQQRQQWKANR